MPNKIRKIISGGQTGADRAAFDFALEHGIDTGGYVPKGRLAEDGRISDKYPNLTETESIDPRERTEMNVIHSDATLILSHGELSGGSKLAEEVAQRFNKPFFHIDINKRSAESAADLTLKWLDTIECEELNIAGPRASEDALIYDATISFLTDLFSGR